MATRSLALLLIVGSLSARVSGTVHGKTREGVRVQVATGQAAYPLGAPVRLSVTVTTTQIEPIPFHQVFSTPLDIEVYLSDDGKHFARWTGGVEDIVNI